MLEQFLRFFDFDEILPRSEIDEDWREHLGYGRCSIISDVEARKSKRAAQGTQLQRCRPLSHRSRDSTAALPQRGHLTPAGQRTWRK